MATGMAWLLCFGLLNGWYPELQRRIILRALVEGLGVDAELGGARGSLIGGLTLEELVVRPNTSDNTSGTNELPLAIDEAHIDLDLSRIYDERVVVVRSFEIENLALHIEHTPLGEWKFLGLPTRETARVDLDNDDIGNAITDDAPEPPPLRLEIMQFIVRNADLFLHHTDPDDPGELTANGRLVTRDLSWPFEASQSSPPTVTADLRVTGGSFRGARVQAARLRLTANLERIEAKLERADLELFEATKFYVAGALSANLIDGLPQIEMADGRIAFTHLDLSALDALTAQSKPKASPQTAIKPSLPRTDLNGELHVSTAGEGIAFAPSSLPLKVQLNLDASEFENLSMLSAQAAARYETGSGVWRLDTALLDTSEGHFEASGSGQSKVLDNLRIEAAGLPIQALLLAFDVRADAIGELNISAQLSGAIDDPSGTVSLEGGVAVAQRPDVEFTADISLHGEQRFTLERLALDTTRASKLQLTTSTPATISHIDAQWSLTDLRLHGPSGNFEIEEFISADALTSLDASIADVNIRAFAEFFSPADPPEGSLSGKFNLIQQHDQLAVDGELTVLALRYRGTSTNKISLRSTSGDGANSIEGAIQWDDDHSVAVSLRLPGAIDALTPPAVLRHPEFEFALFAKDMPARVLHNLLPGDPERKEPDPELFKGTLTGAFGVKGDATGPVVVGSGNWTNAHWGPAVADNVKLTATTVDETLSLVLEISHEGRNGFVANASIDLAQALVQPDQLLLNPDNRASLHAQAIDLAWLVPRASTRRLGRVRSLTGDATGLLEIAGSPSGPQLQGTLDVIDAKLRLALVEERVGPINASLVFANDSVKMERVEVQSQKGPVVFSGHFNWAGSEKDQVELRAHFDNFALTHFPLFDARVNGDILIDGGLSTLDARGELVLTRVQVNLPAPEDPLFREVRILGLAQADSDAVQRTEPSAYETARADIAIEVGPGAKIRERGADFEAEGQMRLRKKRMASTLLQGNLQTTGGTYKFLGRTFNVDEGAAIFDERVPPDPELHLIATRPSGDVIVGVELTGRWSAPSSRLISTPTMDDTEILSYLVFDKPSTQIGERDDQQLNAAAAQLAGNLALASLSRALSEELPINEISVDVNNDMSVRSVGVETNVGEDIILRYDRALQSTAGDRLTVEWRFWKDLSLRSEYDANGGSSGLDVFWSYEY